MTSTPTPRVPEREPFGRQVTSAPTPSTTTGTVRAMGGKACFEAAGTLRLLPVLSLSVTGWL